MRFQPDRERNRVARLSAIGTSRYWRAAEAERALAAWRPALTLELRGGRRVRVRAGFDPELLTALVRTVEGWGC